LPVSFDGIRPPLPGNTPSLGEHNHLLATPSDLASQAHRAAPGELTDALLRQESD
jgi:hypothetical protein